MLPVYTKSILIVVLSLGTRLFIALDGFVDSPFRESTNHFHIILLLLCAVPIAHNVRENSNAR